MNVMVSIVNPESISHRIKKQDKKRLEVYIISLSLLISVSIFFYVVSKKEHILQEVNMIMLCLVVIILINFAYLLNELLNKIVLLVKTKINSFTYKDMDSNLLENMVARKEKVMKRFSVKYKVILPIKIGNDIFEFDKDIKEESEANELVEKINKKERINNKWIILKDNIVGIKLENETFKTEYFKSRHYLVSAIDYILLISIITLSYVASLDLKEGLVLGIWSLERFKYISFYWVIGIIGVGFLIDLLEVRLNQIISSN